MQIGLGAPVSGSWATPAAMVEIARRAEELGYASLWTFQRLLVPAGSDGQPAAPYRSVHDPLTTLAYLAAVTERVRLGVAVVNLPFYSPILLAKALTTVDILSGGRLDAGLGLGWSPEEYAAVGVPMADRGRRAEDFLACLRAIWTSDIVEYDGPFYSVPASRVEPKPVQRPHPPLLLGGAAEAALRRAGRLADGWISGSAADLAGIGGSIATVREAAVQAGRDPAAVRAVCRGPVRVRPGGQEERPLLTGSLEELRADLVQLDAQGVDEVFLDLNFDPEIGSPEADPAVSLRRAYDVMEALAPVRV